MQHNTIYEPKSKYGYVQLPKQEHGEAYSPQTLLDQYKPNACLGHMFGVPAPMDETNGKPVLVSASGEIEAHVQNMDISGCVMPTDEEMLRMLKLQEGGPESGLWNMGQQNMGVMDHSGLDLGAMQVDGDAEGEMDVDMFGGFTQPMESLQVFQPSQPLHYMAQPLQPPEQPLTQHLNIYAAIPTYSPQPAIPYYLNAHAAAGETFNPADPLALGSFPQPCVEAKAETESFPSFEEINTIPDYEAGGILAAPPMTAEELRAFGLSLADYLQDGEDVAGMGMGEGQSIIYPDMPPPPPPQQQQQQQQQQQPATDEFIFGDYFLAPPDDTLSETARTEASAETETETETNPSQPLTIDWTENDEWALRLTGNTADAFLWGQDRQVETQVPLADAVAGAVAGSASAAMDERGGGGKDGVGSVAGIGTSAASQIQVETQVQTQSQAQVQVQTQTPVQVQPQAQPTPHDLLHRYPILHFWNFPYATHALTTATQPSSAAASANPFPQSVHPFLPAAAHAWAAIATTYTSQSNIRLLRAHSLLRWRILVVDYSLIKVQLVRLEAAGREEPVHDALWLMCAPAPDTAPATTAPPLTPALRTICARLLAHLAAQIPRDTRTVAGVAIGRTALFFLWDALTPRNNNSTPPLHIPCTSDSADAQCYALDEHLYAPATNGAVDATGRLSDAAFWSAYGIEELVIDGGGIELHTVAAGILAIENVLLGIVNLRHPGLDALQTLLPQGGAWMLPCEWAKVKKKRGRKKKVDVVAAQYPFAMGAVAAPAQALAPAPAAATTTAASNVPKKRGRKPGSKNKPKPPPDPNAPPVPPKTRKSAAKASS